MAEIERFGVGKRLTDFIVHGGTIRFSGYVAEEVAGKSVTEQTRDILAQIDGSLAEAGSDKSKLIEATIWLADRHGDLRRDERGVGRVGGARASPDARVRRSEARLAAVRRRDPGARRAVGHESFGDVGAGSRPLRVPGWRRRG